MAKGSFGLTFNKVKNNKDNTERKALFLRKRERAIIIHQRCIVCKRLICKNLEACYYAFLEIAPKGGAPSVRVTTRATSVMEGRKKGIVGRSITAQVGRGRCDQRSELRIAIFLRCLRSLPSQLWVVAPSLFIDKWKEPPGWPTELQEYIAYNLYSGLFRCLGHLWPYHILPKALGPISLSPNIVTRS